MSDYNTNIPLQPSSEIIWDSKHRLKNNFGEPIDKTREDTFFRVAKTLAKQEEDFELWNKEFTQIMLNGCIPAGRILSNAGANEYKPNTTLINCVVASNIKDSLFDILSVGQEVGMTLKTGAGIGMCFSTIRPKGAFVKGVGAFTSGPLSFADVYDKICFTISSAGGRRGSMMFTFHVFHPDVYDVIKAKRENGRLRQFNISLLITDEFINAVKNDDKWDLYFPIHKDDPYLKEEELTLYADWPIEDEESYTYREDGKVLCKIYKTVRAKHLWEEIMKSNYDFGDPGFILIDKVNRENNLYFIENIIATNPCVTGDTLILTDKGYLEIESVVNNEINVWNGYEFSKVIPKVTNRNQKILQIEFANGNTIKCTPYHQFISNNKRIEAQHLTLDHKIDRFEFPIIEGNINWSQKRAYTQGFYSGDGEQNKPRIWLYNEKIELLEYLDYKTFSDQSNSSNNTRLMVTVGCELYPKQFVPNSEYNIITRLNWLAGIIDSDGSEYNGVVQISSIDKNFLLQIKYLLNTLGVDGNISLMKAKANKIIKGKSYSTQNCWRISINKANINKLFDLGLSTIRVNTENEESFSNNVGIKIKSILELDEIADKVYCFNEPIRHLGCFNGLITGNCGKNNAPLKSNL